MCHRNPAPGSCEKYMWKMERTRSLSVQQHPTEILTLLLPPCFHISQKYSSPPATITRSSTQSTGSYNNSHTSVFKFSLLANICSQKALFCSMLKYRFQWHWNFHYQDDQINNVKIIMTQSFSFPISKQNKTPLWNGDSKHVV